LSFKTGEPDYTLFVDGKVIATIEAKPEGHSLVGVEEQSGKYVTGVPAGLPAWRSPLPSGSLFSNTRLPENYAEKIARICIFVDSPQISLVFCLK